MVLEIAKLVYEAAQELELDVEMREAYSGRGMFGRTTACLTGSRSDIMEAAEEARVKTAKWSWDNMGLDMVAY